MARVSFMQTSFLGGIWSPSAQGRMHDQAWKTALSECLNAYPTEEGAWTRRGGFMYAQHTRHGAQAVLRSFDFEIDAPYIAEFTDSKLRLRTGPSLVRVADGDIHVSGISTATPAVVYLADTIPANWAAGDTVMFDLVNIPSSAPILTNRQFTIGTITDNSFTIKDPITGDDIDGSTIAYVLGATLDKVFKIFELDTPYAVSDLAGTKIVSDDSTVLILNNTKQQRVLTVGDIPQPFAIAVQEFSDGPYLDIQDPKVSQTTLSLSGTSGSVTVTASDTDAINDGRGFLSTDVGRLIRFQGGPQMWDSGTAYSKGDQVTGSDGNIYTSQGGLTGVDPTLDDGTHWVLSTAKVNWVSLKITARTDETHVTATLLSDLRGAGVFASVTGDGNIRAKFDGLNQSYPALEASYPEIDFKQYFAAGQQVAVSNGAFTDGGGGDISGTYTVRSIFNDPDDRRSVMLFTDEDGATAGWTVVNGLSDKRTAPYSPEVGLNLVGDYATTTAWRLGAYSDTTGYPSCGTYHEGRLWLSGAIPNRVDASKSDDHFNFSPTDTDGTVADDNAIAATANATELNNFFWLRSGEYGLTLGSLAGEWLVRAATTDDPITPSSIQMRRVTTYGCADVEPQLCLRSLVFVQRQQRRVMDFANYPWGEAAGWFADNLEHLAGTLVCGGVAEIRYQQTPAWNLWARRNDGTLVGTVFRHAAYGKESFNGWHRHEHGDDRIFESIAVSSTPTETGLGETLFAVTNQTDADDPDHNIRWVEMLSPEFDDCSDDCDALFIDGSVVPANTTVLTGGTPPTGIRIYGYWHLNGKTISVFLGGLDLGDFTVTNGYVDVPFSGTFTWAYFQTLETCDLTGTTTTTQTTAHESNPFQGSLEAFVASGSPVGYNGSGGSFYTDPAVPYVVGLQSTFGGNNGGIQVFNRNTAHGDEVGESDNAAVFGAGPAHTFVDSSAVLHPNGNIYAILDGISNSVMMGKVRVSDRTLQGTFGTANSGFGSSDTNIQYPAQMIPVLRGGLNYLVSYGPDGAEVAIWALDDAVMGFVEKTNPAGGALFLCEGVRGRGDYYVAAYHASISTNPLILYEGWAPSTELRQICSLAPSDIDPAWTHISGVSGLALDKADGNLVTFIQTTDVVAEDFYLIKVDRMSGTILWKSPVPDAFGCNLCLCNLNGTLQMFNDGGGHDVITVGLSDGSQTTTVWNAGIGVGGNYYDCSSASIFTIGSYTHSATGPTPTLLGDYFANNASVSTRVLEIFSGDTVFQDGDTVTTTYPFYGGAGFTYTSRGQLLRPDFGQDAGTQLGPAFGKLRRISQAAIALVKSRGVSMGTEFDKLNTVPLQTAGKRDIAAPTLYTGTVASQDFSVNDSGPSTDASLCWEITRPWPCTITAIAGMIEAQS